MDKRRKPAIREPRPHLTMEEMRAYLTSLREIESVNGDPLLQGAGSVSHSQAMEKAETEYRKWEVQTLSPVEEAYLATIKMLNNKGKGKK